MSLNNLKIVINLDGSGIYFDRNEPLHLDAMLAYQMAGLLKKGNCERSDIPEDVPLPLLAKTIDNNKLWCASAFFIDDDTPEIVRYWRKKFRLNQSENTKGSPNLQNGVYREYNMPVQLLLARTATAYCIGSRKEVKRLLNKFKYFGKKSSQGIGRINSIEVDYCDEDYSLVMNEKAMRWLPDKNGVRMVRVKPPYWNNTNRIMCCEIGDNYTIK